MTGFWGRASGPLIALVATLALVAVPSLAALPPPAPGALLLVIVFYATIAGGTICGLLSGLIGIVGAAHILAEPGTLLVMTPAHLFRLVLVIAFSFGIPLVVARMRDRGERLLRREKHARTTAETVNKQLLVLHGALDKVDHGLLLLDENLRADFMNAAFARLWGIDAGEAERRPTFAELVERARRAGAKIIQPMPDDDYVARRMALVREGSEAPLYIRLTGGKIVRSQCKILPSGGRLLSYTDVTDLVHQAEEFERLATTDDLTGVYCRRHYLVLAEEAFARSVASGQALSLLILDIDLFKSINDRFGHAAGDGVIRHVADVCRDVQRSDDVLARIGGEEFTLLLPNTGLAQAAALAETIRASLDGAPVVVDDHSLRVTVSIGVAGVDATMTSLDDLMRRADRSLYDAKRAGRNCVHVAASETGKKVRAATAAA